jgi:DNA-binding NarL/FixJ family response regulator
MMKSVAVVEDDQGLRDQFVEILNAAPDIRCIGAFASGEEALRKIPLQYPDVVLMDIRLPGISGIQCVAELKKLRPSLQILMVTVYEDTDRIFKALRAGASGYLVKSSPPAQLLDSVRDVFAGGAPMSSQIARRVVRHFHLLGPAPEEAQNLSPREQQVIESLASGLLYKEIADQLDIGIQTVRTHVKNICLKMHVRNRVEAVAKHYSDAC